MTSVPSGDSKQSKVAAEDVDSDAIHVALILAGGASMGSYQAGVLAELFHQLDCHNSPHIKVCGKEFPKMRKGKEFKVDVVSASSAGGINTVLTALNLLDHESPNNPGYKEKLREFWLEKSDIQNLAKYEAEAAIFSGDYVEEIKNEFLQPSFISTDQNPENELTENTRDKNADRLNARGVAHEERTNNEKAEERKFSIPSYGTGYLAASFSVSHLPGVDASYGYAQSRSEGRNKRGGFSWTYFNQYAQVILPKTPELDCNNRAIQNPGRDYAEYEPKYSEEYEKSWNALLGGAAAASAIPFAFAPQFIDPKLLQLDEDVCGFETHEHAMVDGGLFDNEPVAEAFKLARKLDYIYHRDKPPRRIFILIDPTANDGQQSCDKFTRSEKKNDLSHENLKQEGPQHSGKKVNLAPSLKGVKAKFIALLRCIYFPLPVPDTGVPSAKTMANRLFEMALSPSSSKDWIRSNRYNYRIKNRALFGRTLQAILDQFDNRDAKLLAEYADQTLGEFALNSQGDKVDTGAHDTVGFDENGIDQDDKEFMKSIVKPDQSRTCLNDSQDDDPKDALFTNLMYQVNEIGDLTRKYQAPLYLIGSSPSLTAGEKLFGIAGFLEKEWRDHDYRLGRRNARDVLPGILKTSLEAPPEPGVEYNEKPEWRGRISEASPADANVANKKILIRCVSQFVFQELCKEESRALRFFAPVAVTLTYIGLVFYLRMPFYMQALALFRGFLLALAAPFLLVGGVIWVSMLWVLKKSGNILSSLISKTRQ